MDILRIPNFRLLWVGEGISLLGDQFYFIALPWLVLQLTGNSNAFAVGVVLSLNHIPRALFMLVGGALTDRFSPRAVMLGSNLARMGFVGILALLVLTGQIYLWMLYVFALSFGIADAFYYPAQTAIVPQILEKKAFQAGNALVQGTGMLAQAIGPALAGGMIAIFGTKPEPGAPPDMSGIGLALVIDALTFLASVAALWRIKAKHRASTGDQGVLKAIRAGLAYVWNNVVLRMMLVIIAANYMLVFGPLYVGIPVLADTRLEGAGAYGAIMSAYGVGSLLGVILAGTLPKPAPKRFGTLFVALAGLVGIGLIVIGLTQSTWLIAISALVMGGVNTYIGILGLTWLQSRVPQAMLGRVMSLLLFASVGLAPVAQPLAGALIDIIGVGLFIGAGVILLAILLWAATIPEIRRMGLDTQAEAKQKSKSTAPT